MMRLRRLLRSLTIGAVVMAAGTAFGIRIGLAVAATEPVAGTQGIVMAALADGGSSDLKDRYALAMDDGVLTAGEERDLYALIDGQIGVVKSPGGTVIMRDDGASTAEMI